MSDSKQLQFDNLVERVAHCSLCPRMLSRTKVLTSLNGSLHSQIIFVAEAPGRLGADKYGLPLHGDQTGRNFEMFLNHSGFYRDSVFITNAVLCNPRSIDGNNDSPTISEIRNCSSFLDETIKIINPQYIVTLGLKALISLNTICHHEISLSEDIGHLIDWNGHQVFPLYHPGPMAMIKRPKAQQFQDYESITRIFQTSG